MLFTVSVTATVCPTMTVVGVAPRLAPRAAGFCTVTVAAVAGVALTGWPLLASVPAAVPLTVSVPALAALHVQE